MRLLKLAAAALGLMLLTACQTELYSKLSEREANEMMSALLAEGIEASKAGAGDGFFTITVDQSDVRTSLDVLARLGLPRGTRDSIGQVFAKSGIVSSPFEERVRYIYALSEDMAQTLQQIDGVLVARVHIVMPEEPELGQEVKPASAAVFIKQIRGYDLDYLIPQIRRLVASSIEGLDYESVTIVLVEAQEQLETTAAPAVALTEPVPGVRVVKSSMGLVYWIVGAVVGLVLVLLLVVAVLMAQLRRARRDALAEAEDV